MKSRTTFPYTSIVAAFSFIGIPTRYLAHARACRRTGMDRSDVQYDYCSYLTPNLYMN